MSKPNFPELKYYRITYVFNAYGSGNPMCTNVVFSALNETEARTKFLHWCCGSTSQRIIRKIERI